MELELGEKDGVGMLVCKVAVGFTVVRVTVGTTRNVVGELTEVRDGGNIFAVV